jgi:hypothetical protein
VEFAAVPNVTVAVAALVPSRVTEAGVMPQVTFVGRLPQDKFTAEVDPWRGLIVSAEVPDCPAVTVKVAGATPMP